MLNIRCERSQLPAGTTAFLEAILLFLLDDFLVVAFFEPLPYNTQLL